MCRVASENSGTSASSAVQAAANDRSVGLKPVGVLHHLDQACVACLGRTDQAQARLNGAVVQHQAGGGHLHRRPVRPAIDQIAAPWGVRANPAHLPRRCGRRITPLFCAMVRSWVAAPEPGWV